jgi:transposase
VLLVAQGMTCPEVGRLLGDAPRPVEYWVRHFEERGLSGLVEGARAGRPKRLSAAQRQEVELALRRAPTEAGLSGTLWDGKTLQVWLARRYGVQFRVRQCQRMFRQFGFRLCKPRPLIAHADAELQKTQKELQALGLDAAVDLWAMDEVHFQQYGSRCRMWVPPESKDPVLLHYPTRRSVGYFGVARLRDGKLCFRRETDKFNALTCGKFL